ncbi:MAG: S8 family serine peptidase, partial [Candidatus Deferrimicrobiaceae bacterium]
MDVAPDLRKIDPLMLATDESAVVAAQGKVMRASGRLSSLPRVFVHLRGAEQAFPAKIEALGGTASPIHARLFSGAIPRDAARYLSRWPEVAYIESEKLARPMLDLSRLAVSANLVQAGTGLPAAYDGTGTYVGVVDTGLSIGHLDFFTNGDPSLSRVAHWYPNEANAGVDTSWHGTHVTGIAAGNGFLSGGRFTGMAPGADLLVAQTNFTTVDIQNAVANLLTFAGTTPVAINLSLGLLTGPHDGSSGFENAIGFYATNGVSPGGKQILSAAAGNERTHRGHFQSVLPPFGSVSASLSLEADSSHIDGWADGQDRYTVTATLGGESATATTGTNVSSPGGRVTIHNRTDAPPNGATHISVFFSASTATSASILLRRTRNGGNGKVDAYIDLFEGNFSVGTQAETITEPANAEDVIAVGAFETKTPGGSLAAQNISSFSSLGPTRDGRGKPDLAAPGTILYSAKSVDPYLDAPPEPQTVPGEPDYIIEQGTSMSAPHVAGVAALVWQSNPALTGAQMRERLKRTASAPTDGSTVPNMTWGYGKINALSAITETVAGISGPARTLPGQNLTLRADEKTSGPYGNAVTYSWSAPGAAVTSLTGPSTTFNANTPGDYPVTLTAVPGSSPYNQAVATIRVNTVPIASISGPSAVDNVRSIPFAGTGMDADAQPLSFHWILVARPSGSASVLTIANVEDVTLVPDVSGTYELGLRVNDGLEDSALAMHTVTVGLVTSSSGGGGGGCAYVNGKGEDDAASTVATLLLLLSPLGVLWARKR